MMFLAYIDPVSGTLLLQLLIAGVVGTIAFFRRTVWGFVTRVVRRRPSTEETPE